jgi:signal transduction histidine kinase/ActR/RegA family two-component response regulator
MAVKKQKNEKENWHHSSALDWIALVLLIILLAIITSFFFRSTKKQLYSERQDHLSELTIKIGDILSNDIVSLKRITGSAKAIIDRSDISDTEHIDDLLLELETILGLENGRIVCFDNKGVYYMSDGYTARWSTPEDLEYVDGTPVLRDMNINGKEDTYMIFIRELDSGNITDETGLSFTHVALIEPMSDMKNTFSITGFGGASYAYLVNPNGQRLYKQTYENSFIEAFNVLSVLEKYSFTMDGSAQELSQAVADRENACMQFVIDDTGEDYFVATVPIGNTDWAVLEFVPTNVLGRNSNLLMKNMLRYVIFIALQLIIIMSVLIWMSMRRHSEQRILEEKEKNNIMLEEMAEKATRANQAKTEFLAHMSHDIRTPINGIVGMENIAMKNINNPVKLRDCLMKISGAADHLLSLINDVLEMSRIESGHIEIAHKPIDISSIIDNCFSIISGQLIDRQVALEKDIKCMEHSHLFGDELRIRQIFINILGNAVKFTPDGGSITLRVEERMTDSDDKVLYHFEFEDTGIGMSEEFVEHLFEPFSQEDGGSRTTYQGTGLGMAITKQLVENMGGTINVRSQLDKGSCFIVEIPFTINKQAVVKTQTRVNVKLKGMKVLLVEDNDLNMEIAQEILEDEGIQVTPAVDGQEAVDIFLKSPQGTFDLILMDIMMPHMNGYEATQAIRTSEHPDGRTIPIIAMTANAYAEDVAKALDAGMNAHVSKPIDINHLFFVLGQNFTM